MVSAFALLTLGALAIIAGFTGRGLGETIRGTLGRGFAFAGLDIPDIAERATPAAGDTSATSLASYAASAGTSGGAKGIVEAAVETARPYGTYVASDYRPGDPKDHGSNDADKAARDIAVQGIDAIHGPPSPKLDQAVVAIGALFGKRYRPGITVIDTFHWRGFRIQIIWRTPLYGGHLGHIHIGARAE